MSKNRVEYFTPGKAILLIATLLLASMALQLCTLPQVLKPSVNGEVVEGTVVGVVLIFSYTLTTLAFLFLLMEYFKLKDKVKVYVKLTEPLLPSEALEKSIVAEAVAPVTIALPKEEKPAKKGLFIGFGKRVKKEKVEKVKALKPKGKGFLSFLSKKVPPEKTAMNEPKTEKKGGFSLFKKNAEKKEKVVKESKSEKKGGFSLFKKNVEKKEEVVKELKPGLFARFKRKKEAPEAESVEPTIKKISVEATTLLEKPAQIIEPIKPPVATAKIESEKPPVVLIQKMVEPTVAPVIQAIATPKKEEKSSIADLLGGMNIAKPKDETTAMFEKLKPTGVISEEKKPTSEPVDESKTGDKPSVSSEPKKAADLLKAAAEAHGEDDTKYKTLGGKVPVAEPAKKPVVTLPPMTLTPEPKIDPVTVADSEFLKVLTELRTVVDDMKTKKKVNT